MVSPNATLGYFSHSQASRILSREGASFRSDLKRYSPISSFRGPSAPEQPETHGMPFSFHQVKAFIPSRCEPMMSF